MVKNILLVAVLCLSSNLQAIEQQWTNVKLQYNDYSADAKSKAILGRYEIIDNFYVSGKYLDYQIKYDWTSFDEMTGISTPVNITRDHRTLSLGFGGYFDITDRVTMNVELNRSKSDNYKYYAVAEEGHYLNPCPTDGTIFQPCNTITSERSSRDIQFYNTQIKTIANWELTDNLVLYGGLFKRRDSENGSWDTPFYRELGILYFVTPEFGIEYTRVDKNSSNYHINRFNVVYAF